AVAVDGQLVTIPQINFEQYPDGVIGANGADITGALTRNSAREIAAMLRLGALPVDLKLISAR
ncbi:MAG: SecDF P1 head subdomain-containing protein, partial [Solirubrobacteraceae bacterium]